MTYPPKIHQENNTDYLIEVIKSYPLATLISVKNNVPFITHLPLIFNVEGNLIGHIDKFNPHAEIIKSNKDITVIFSGPQCYISPSVYTTTQLPTWNYIKVHVTGEVKQINSEEALKNSLIKMTSFLEQPNPKYILKPDNQRMLGLLNYIEMFEITIQNWEGKFKLSQDKNAQDRENAKNELIKQNKNSIESFLQKIFK